MIFFIDFAKPESQKIRFSQFEGYETSLLDKKIIP